jgi:acyl carrier protein
VTAVDAAVLHALTTATHAPAHTFADGRTELQALGVDSLALLHVVRILQDALGIVVPDEVTARVRTVADLRQAVAGPAAAPDPTPARTQP